MGWTWELRKPWRRPGGAGAAGGLELLFGSSRQSQLWPELEAGSPVGTAISPTLHLLEVANWTLLVLLGCLGTWLENDRGAAAWRGFPSKVRAFPLSTFSLISLIALLPFPCRPSTRLIWTSLNQSESKTWQSRINWWKFCWTKVGADRLSSLPPDSCQRPIHSNPKIAIFLSLPNKSIETRWGGRTYLNTKECQPNYVITLTYFENFPVSRHYFATVLLLVHISSISQLCSTKVRVGRLRLKSICGREGGRLLMRLLCAQTESPTWRVHIFVQRLQLSSVFRGKIIHPSDPIQSVHS